MPRPPIRDRVAFDRPAWPDWSYVTTLLRQETVGGALLIVATVLALAWANSPWSDAYISLRDATPDAAWLRALHLDLSVAEWAGDGLLAVFFFVAGLELKRELVLGSLRRPAEALLPVAAAVTGMALPALIYLAVTAGDPAAARGWAVPTATDIAFCLAVLAVVGGRLPSALRAFLLTLAVVDDLLAIVIIAVVYSTGVDLAALAAAAVSLAAYALLARDPRTPWPLLLAVAVLAWVLTHAAGVHPTVAGVAVGLLTPARRAHGESQSPVERFEHRWRPVSAGFAVPVFALFSVGIVLDGDALVAAAGDPAAVGVVVARLVGKTVGVFAGSYLLARLTTARLNPDLAWRDVFALSVLTGIGFAVPLLVSDVTFGAGSPRDDRVTAAILTAALAAAVLGALLLRLRHRHYSRLAQEEERDADGDGVPDVYQRASAGPTGQTGQTGHDSPSTEGTA